MHVVVVGAGPTGMVLGMVLARAGIKVTLLEKESTTDERPRAAHLTPPTMRLLERAGLAEDVRRKGWTPNNFAWRKLDGTIITSIEDFGQSKNPISMVVLPLGPLGKIILDHASREDNITIKFNHSVTGVGQDDHSAWALVRNEDRSEFKVAGDYVVGCDGGTSSVRKSLYGPRHFPGQTWDERLIASNVIYPVDKFGWDDLNTIIHPSQRALIAKITQDGLWRVSYIEDKDFTYEEARNNVANRYATLLPGNPKPEDFTLVDFSFYSQHQRCVEKFRLGRVLLAADAAHLCNPWGGMGLTGGFADVAGLAECLEGIHAGKADESILDKYDEVRREIFHHVISPTSTANYLRVASDPDKVNILEEDPFLKMVHAAKNDPVIKEKLNKGVYAVSHDFTQYYNDKI
ncbi:FAD-dependent monooxygenase [Lachnellula occidentalis]|uniref:FAD-dependent monooxygenase n=1 Tax=Lachnellula occidentalis TaxID=215460 RepID=A0A8H8UHH3_9HELO|nr:FAD-dependent monooxygenase [Lachnellula occidentalis]